MNRTFDRLPEFDEASRNFPIRSLIGPSMLRRPRSWRLLERLDQGREGACVGFGFAHELAALPVRSRQSAASALDIYHRAQFFDGYRFAEGASVLAGAKAVREQGHMDEFRWAFGAGDVLDALSAHGPVVIGVNWREGMLDTTVEGYIFPRGEVVGGHCVCLRGVGRQYGAWYAIGRNSWGVGWGVRGDFKISEAGLAVLLADEGDACVPVVRR